MYSGSSSSYRPGGGDLYRPSRQGPQQGNYNRDEYAARPNERQNYSDRSNYRSGTRYERGQNGHSRSHNTPNESHYGGQGSNRGPNARSHGSYQNHSSSWLRTQRPLGDGYHLVYTQMQAENQVWMGDLDPRWSENDIASIWNELGEPPVNVKIMRDKAGRSQYCFVTFANQVATNAAVQRNRTPVPGSSRVFKLNKASNGSSNADAGRQNYSSTIGQTNARPQVDFSVFVGDLTQEVTEQMLFARFNQQYPGAVKQVKIMTDANSGASKGFGFVRFHQEEAQKLAIKDLNGVILGHRAIRVALASGGQEQSSAVKRSNSDLTPAVKLPQQQPSLSAATDPNSSVILITGINMMISEKELEAHFSSFGTLIYCKIDYKAQQAHVKYLMRNSAEKAFLFMSRFSINGCSLKLKWGREERNTSTRTKFVPPAKSAKNVYLASEKLPNFYGDLESDVALAELNGEQITNLSIIEPSDFLSVKDFDLTHKSKLERRAAYLEEAF